MSRAVWVVRHDEYHPRAVVDPAVAAAFDGPDWEVRLTERARDLLADAAAVDLAVFFANGRAAGEGPLSAAEEQALAQRVEEGMGLLRVHAGLVLIEADSPLQRRLNTGRFISHPRHEGAVEFQVDYVPLRQVKHPILEGVGPFGGRDEHYWCQLAVERTDLLLAATSAVGTGAAGWAHEVGRGRVAALTPGHTAAVLMHPMMLKLLGNAARWCARRQADETAA
ncbi:MAG: ThuA domain-containing protein [Gemmatimonadota bacterium]